MYCQIMCCQIVVLRIYLPVMCQYRLLSLVSVVRKGAHGGGMAPAHIVSLRKMVQSGIFCLQSEKN